MFLREECGFDIAFDYKIGPRLEQLEVEAPDGIDVSFDNVGGETLEAALSALRVHGSIIACGRTSNYNAEKPQPGPSNLFSVRQETPDFFPGWRLMNLGLDAFVPATIQNSS